jgi:hypothetical protein
MPRSIHHTVDFQSLQSQHLFNDGRIWNVTSQLLCHTKDTVMQPVYFARRKTPSYHDARINGFTDKPHQQTVNQHSYVQRQTQTNTTDKHVYGVLQSTGTILHPIMWKSDTQIRRVLSWLKAKRASDVQPPATVTLVTLQELGDRLMACTCPVPDTPCWRSVVSWLVIRSSKYKARTGECLFICVHAVSAFPSHNMYT